MNLLGDRLSRDRLRVLRANATYDFADRFRGVSLVALELSQGLNILDARGANEANTSREDGKTNFTKIGLSGQRLQALRDSYGFLWVNCWKLVNSWG